MWAKDVTCALVVITPDDNFLIVHPTNAPQVGSWSFPKGLKEVDETPAQAAARECWEETGLDFRDQVDNFIDCERHPYVKGKDLHLFIHNHSGDLNVNLFECNTHFTDRNGKQVVEVDRYKLVNLTEAEVFVNKKQLHLLAYYHFKQLGLLIK